MLPTSTHLSSMEDYDHNKYTRLIELGTSPLFKDYYGNPLVDCPDWWHNP